MLLKDYVKDLVDLLKDKPYYGDLEVWTYSDDEGNFILPMYSGCTLGYVENGVTYETDEYIPKEYLKDHLEDYETSLEDFESTHKEIILL